VAVHRLPVIWRGSTLLSLANTINQQHPRNTEKEISLIFFFRLRSCEEMSSVCIQNDLADPKHWRKRISNLGDEQTLRSKKLSQNFFFESVFLLS